MRAQKSSNTIEALTEIEVSSGETLKRAFNPNDLRDLQILLDQPQKHVTPFETYISYHVSTKVGSFFTLSIPYKFHSKTFLNYTLYSYRLQESILRRPIISSEDATLILSGSDNSYLTVTQTTLCHHCQRNTLSLSRLIDMIETSSTPGCFCCIDF